VISVKILIDELKLHNFNNQLLVDG